MFAVLSFFCVTKLPQYDCGFFTFFLFISSSYLYAKDCNISDRTSFGVKQNSELTSTITEDDDPFKSSDEVPLYTGVIEPIHSAFKEQGYIK